MHSLINNAVTQSKNGKQCPNSRIYVLSKMDKHGKLNVKKEVIRDKFLLILFILVFKALKAVKL